MGPIIYSYYLLTNRKLLEVAAKICHFNKYVHVRLSLKADISSIVDTANSTLSQSPLNPLTDNAPGFSL